MKICLTIDYELFMGHKAGTIENCLINPLNVLSRSVKGLKLTVFVDGAYIWRMQSYPELKEDYDRVLNHLSQLSNQGHEIQFHFHPQWLYSKYEGGSWIMDLDHYKLSDVEDDVLDNVFPAALNIIRSVSRNEVCAFRAGGYTIQTYKKMRKLFVDNGIRIDSSVMPGAVDFGDKQYYDYRNAPKLPYWRFYDDVTSVVSNGDLLEVPITTRVPKSNFHYLFEKNKLQKSHGNSPKYGDGISIDAGQSGILRKLKKFFVPCIFPASIDGLMSEYLPQIYTNYDGEVLTAIGHPKNFTDKSINNTAEFIARCPDAEIITMSQLYA